MNIEKFLCEGSFLIKDKVREKFVFKEIKKKLSEINYHSIETHPKMRKLIEVLENYFKSDAANA